MDAYPSRLPLAATVAAGLGGCGLLALAFRAESGGAAPAGWPLPFTCECDRLGCDQVGRRTLTDYHALRTVGRPVISCTGTE